MARVSTWAVVGIVAGLGIQESATAGVPSMLVGVTSLVGQAAARPSQVHNALNSGIDCYRRADYESAAAFFLQAQAGQDDLSADEQQELANLLRLNTVALKARREGVNQLQQAEKAVQAGRTSEADGLLRKVTVNQFLTARDKFKAQNLAEQLRASAATVKSRSAPRTTVNPAVLARTKLQQARLLMAKADFTGAETMANEAKLLKASYSPGEDTPDKVLEDLNRTQADAKNLLVSARLALQAGDLDRAERLAQAAQRATTGWSFPRLWGDSPAKVMKEVEAAKSRMVLTSSRKSDKPSEMVMAPNEAAHQLVKEGRKALQRGDFGEAKNCATQAQGLNGDFHWWEDTPSKLLGDIQRMAKRAGYKDKGQTTFPNTNPSALTQDGDPHVLLKNARDLMDAGKLDEAEKMVVQLQARPGTSWGLFEDSPEKLLREIRNSRGQRGQDDSAQLMAQARDSFSKAKYDEAKALAQQAEKAHGPYMPWDSNERPAKLIAEINQARVVTQKAKSPEQLAAMDRGWNSRMPGTTDARSPDAVPTSVPQGPRDLPGTYANLPSPAAMPVADSSADKGEGNRQLAMRLMGEAQQMQKDNRLVEARQKALEAQKLNAAYATDSDRPERALIQLAGLANNRIDVLVQEATDYSATAYSDATRHQKAEDDLLQARHLAAGFSLDTQVIDAKLIWVRRNREMMAKAATPTAGALAQASFNSPPSTASSPTQQAGLDMLDKARVELSRGEVETARRLAVEVYNGTYGLQTQADAVLHSIDAEDYSQRILAANRSFDAGLAAYYHKEFSQASNILGAVDLSLLSKEKQDKIKELSVAPEMQTQGITLTSAAMTTGVGQATASDGQSSIRGTSPDENYAKQVQALQEVQFQKLRNASLKAQSEATERFNSGDTDQALEILQTYLDNLRDSPLDPDKAAMLQKQVENRLQTLRTAKAQRSFEKLQDGKQESFNQIRTREAKLEEHKLQQVTELMKQYHAFYSEGKYKDAEMVAMRAHELDPDNAPAAAAMAVAHMARNQSEFADIKSRKENMALRGLNDAEDEGPSVTSKNPLEIDSQRWDIAKNRKTFPKEGLAFSIKTEKERDIERRLNLPISLDFKESTLQQVIEDLRDLTGINIVPDKPAMDDENISLDRPITMHIEGVSTKSALNLLLHNAHLIYIIKDEVLVITTEAHARGTLVSKTYQVTDLIIPVKDQEIPDVANLDKALEKSTFTGTFGTGNTPYAGTHSLTNGTPVGSSPAVAADKPAGASDNLEEKLRHLIKSTIKPESWDDMGGPGTIEYYPLGMALVVSQTPDIQEQVGELLQALRRLQDLSIVVEVRFITIAESFFERIGVDFNINVLADNAKVGSQVISQNFQPFGFNNNFQPSSFVTGLQPGLSPPGVFTPDLNIPIRSSSFGPAIPPFGGYPQIPGQDGGLSLGLAFLSDIQVFMFLEAAQGDRRTNVMQAPKLNMFNGQTSTININNQQFFVTNVVFVQAAGQVVFVPQNTPFPTGVQLTIQSVVSADRRFVRLNLNPILTNLSSPVTALFPVTTFITPVFDNGSQGVPIPFTQFLQQPDFNQVNVRTTVNVPDGGTVLLGGLKTLREGRNEFGPPILSKIPFINRLFKNVGYGREAESLMLMVTPRIIINEEEETRQTGVGQGLGLGGGAPPPVP